MKFNKRDYIVFCILSFTLTFLISFNIAMKVFEKQDGNITSAKDINNEVSLVSTSDVDKFLETDTVIILKLENKGSIIQNKTITAGDIKNSIDGDITLNKIKEYLGTKGYSLTESENGQLTFVKKSKYIPNRYYLGATPEGFLAIFKCNSDGELFIEDPENDKSNRSIETLPEKDREGFKNFRSEFQNKEDALDELMAICS